MIFYCVGKDKQGQDEEHTETLEPDVINSISMNNDHRLTVIANSNSIDNKEDFARKIIHMGQDNAFRSIKFSTDRGYPSGLQITVFLNQADVEERKDPICEIRFITEDFGAGYNIKDDSDKFHLYLNDKEIEFY